MYNLTLPYIEVPVRRDKLPHKQCSWLSSVMRRRSLGLWIPLTNPYLYSEWSPPSAFRNLIWASFWSSESIGLRSSDKGNDYRGSPLTISWIARSPDSQKSLHKSSHSQAGVKEAAQADLAFKKQRKTILISSRWYFSFVQSSFSFFNKCLFGKTHSGECCSILCPFWEYMFFFPLNWMNSEHIILSQVVGERNLSLVEHDLSSNCWSQFKWAVLLSIVFSFIWKMCHLCGELVDIGVHRVV